MRSLSAFAFGLVLAACTSGPDERVLIGGPTTAHQAVATADRPIYTDGSLLNGYQDWSWNGGAIWAAVYTDTSTPLATSSTSQVKVPMPTGYDGFSMAQPTDTPIGDYQSVTFALRGTAGKQVGFYLSNTLGTAGTLTLISLTSTWTTYSYTISNIKGTLTNFNAVIIQDESGAAQTFYVDNVKLVAPPSTPPPVIASFTASPSSVSSVSSGGSTTISWSVTGSITSVTLNGTAKAATGTQAFTQTTNTSYTLAASGVGGSATPQTLTVTVTGSTGSTGSSGTISCTGPHLSSTIAGTFYQNGVLVGKSEAANGAVLGGNGAVLGGNGAVLGGNGAFIGSNGTFLGANGSFLGANGSFLGGNGAVLGGNGSYIIQNGTFLGSNGSFLGSNGQFLGTNGAILGGNGAFLGTNGQFIGANGQFIGTNGAFIGANGQFLGVNGAFLAGNGSFLGGNGTFLGANGMFLGGNGTFIGANGTFLGANGNFLGANGAILGANGGTVPGGLYVIANGHVVAPAGTVSNTGNSGLDTPLVDGSLVVHTGTGSSYVVTDAFPRSGGVIQQLFQPWRKEATDPALYGSLRWRRGLFFYKSVVDALTLYPLTPNGFAAMGQLFVDQLQNPATVGILQHLYSIVAMPGQTLTLDVTYPAAPIGTCAIADDIPTSRKIILKGALGLYPAWAPASDAKTVAQLQADVAALGANPADSPNALCNDTCDANVTAYFLPMLNQAVRIGYQDTSQGQTTFNGEEHPVAVRDAAQYYRFAARNYLFGLTQVQVAGSILNGEAAGLSAQPNITTWSAPPVNAVSLRGGEDTRQVKIGANGKIGPTGTSGPLSDTWESHYLGSSMAGLPTLEGYSQLAQSVQPCLIAAGCRPGDVFERNASNKATFGNEGWKTMGVVQCKPGATFSVQASGGAMIKVTRNGHQNDAQARQMQNLKTGAASGTRYYNFCVHDPDSTDRTKKYWCPQLGASDLKTGVEAGTLTALPAKTAAGWVSTLTASKRFDVFVIKQAATSRKVEIKCPTDEEVVDPAVQSQVVLNFTVSVAPATLANNKLPDPNDVPEMAQALNVTPTTLSGVYTTGLPTVTTTHEPDADTGGAAVAAVNGVTAAGALTAAKTFVDEASMFTIREGAFWGSMFKFKSQYEQMVCVNNDGAPRRLYDRLVNGAYDWKNTYIEIGTGTDQATCDRNHAFVRTAFKASFCTNRFAFDPMYTILVDVLGKSVGQVSAYATDFSRGYAYFAQSMGYQLSPLHFAGFCEDTCTGQVATDNLGGILSSKPTTGYARDTKTGLHNMGDYSMCSDYLYTQGNVSAPVGNNSRQVVTSYTPLKRNGWWDLGPAWAAADVTGATMAFPNTDGSLCFRNLFEGCINDFQTDSNTGGDTQVRGYRAGQYSGCGDANYAVMPGALTNPYNYEMICQ